MMDWDESAELQNKADSMEWLQRFLRCRKNGFTTWVSTFHKKNLTCFLGNELPDHDKRGSFNWTCAVQFTDGEKWMVRFPIDGKVKHSDEKVEIEVATMRLIREQTDIPVPEVKAWGLAAENKLGLGPFIITSFIEGISLGDILCKSESRLMREDVDEGDVERIYRQIAQIHLKLSRLNFTRIGSLSKGSSSKKIAQICSRPLTWKAHEILSVGGVDVFCMFGPRSLHCFCFVLIPPFQVLEPHHSHLLPIISNLLLTRICNISTSNQIQSMTRMTQGRSTPIGTLSRP